MYTYSDPDFIAAEVAYRYETGHFTRTDALTTRRRTHLLPSWVRARSRHRRHGPREA
ncbi:MAG TPA: hypothetical protein H9805_05815 [Candidatus Janibacter merdipullorum]|nr:hypothetical protein [Candidatus Janibacter merdipullorum]